MTDMPIFDQKILKHGTEVKHDGDKLVLSNVMGHDLTLTYRRCVGETWEVRMDVVAEFNGGKRAMLYRSNVNEQIQEFWGAAIHSQFEQDEAEREKAYPTIVAMLEKPKQKRTRKS
jgi:hypothetical protein